MKKIISCFVAAVIMLSGVQSAFAWVNGDTAGEKTLDIDISAYESIIGGGMENGALKLDAGGKVTYKVYVPFRLASLSLNCTLQNGDTKMTLVLNDRKIEKELTTTDTVIPVTPNVLKGEHQFILSFDKPVVIYSATIKRAVMQSQDMRASYASEVNYTELEKAIQTAIIIPSYSSVMMVNGGRRYINNDDPREIPYLENGEIYLPIHSFARAFEYYYEERNDEWVIMNGVYTFHYKNGVLTRQDYSEEPKVISDFSKKVNGKTYISVKYFAELSDRVVRARDGLFVVEYPSNAKYILSDYIYNQLVDEVLETRLTTKTGTTYYVSKNCTACDANDGSYERPFSTIQKACEVAQAGDTVIIGGGVYHELLKPKNNGTASNPITFKAAEGETVRISAAAELGSPVGEQGDMLIYNALTDLGYGKNQLFYKGENLVAGRYPNENTNPTPNIMPELSDIWPVEGNIKTVPNENPSNRVVSDTDLNQEEGYWNGATVIGLSGAGYALQMGKVTSSEPGVLNLGEKSRWWFVADDGHKTDYFYITNHINTVDKAGEWHIEDGKIYIIPPEGETAETLVLEQKIRQVVVDLSESKFIRLEGIDTYGGGMKMNNSEMCMLRDGEYKYISHYTYSADQRDGFIDAMDKYNPDGPPQRGEQGIYIGGRDNIVINNTLQYSAAAGVYVVGNYGYFENNYIADCGYMASYVGGLFISHDYNKDYCDKKGGHLIYQNSLCRAGRHVLGISTNDDSWTGPENIVIPYIPDEVAYNDIYDGALASRDTAPWYQYNVAAGTERLKSRHHNNLVWNSWSNEGSMNALVYYDGLTSMAQFYDNVLFHTNNDVKYDTYVFLQDSRGAETITDTWGNLEIGYVKGGKDALTKSDYPQGKVFRSGASWLTEDQTPYLNSISENTNYINLEKASIPQTAVIEDGLFVPSQNGDWICFKDVDFGTDGTEKNAVDIGFVGNPCNTGDKITVMIGSSMEKPIFTEEAEINVIAPDETVMDNYQIRFNNITGKKNLYVRVDNLKSFKLSQIKVHRIEDDLANLKAGFYADTGSVEKVSAKLAGEIIEKNHTYYSGTTSSIFKFKDVVVPKACNEFMFRMGSGKPYDGQEGEIRIGSVTGEVIGSFKNEKIRWWDYRIQKTPLAKTLEAGTYDIYIVFKEDNTKSSNFLWAGLSTFEQATDFGMFMHMMDESEKQEKADEISAAGLDLDELEFMDDDERREAMEDAGLDPDDFDF